MLKNLAPSSDLRLRNHPILKFTREQPIKINFEGQEMSAYEGETIAAAIIANGKKSLYNSLKFSRPRGLFCSIGKCSSCLMRVDGTPNVRTCIESVKDKMKIEVERGKKIEQPIDKINTTELKELMLTSLWLELDQQDYLQPQQLLNWV